VGKRHARNTPHADGEHGPKTAAHISEQLQSPPPEHGAELLGISVDGVWCHAAFARDRNLRFPLLSDFEPKGAVSRACGAYRTADGTSERALFVLDSDGVIRWSYLSPIDVNPGVDGILKALESLTPRSAAEAAEAAGAQGAFWEMHDMLFQHQNALEREDFLAYAATLNLDRARFARDLDNGVHAAKVRDDFSGGVRSGVNGTPTFFINGERFDGNWADPSAFIVTLAQAAGSGHPSR
jgi:hypothetical protein